MQTLCGQYETVVTAAGRYNVSTNAWGDDGSGKQCLMVEQADEPSNSTSFAVTWNWENEPDLVHSYPNVNLNSRLLPIRLNKVGALKVDAAWSMAPGRESTGIIDLKALDEADAQSNVALDIFLDRDPARSTSTTEPSHEIMIWFTTISDKNAIGWQNGIVTQQNFSGVGFDLYTGANDNGQQVYSWLAQKDLSNFNGDVLPLVNYLWRDGGNSSLDGDFYAGIIQFGTEAFHVSPGNEVTFNASRVVLEVESADPQDAPLAANAASRGPSPHAALPLLCFLLMGCRVLRWMR